MNSKVLIVVLFLFSTPVLASIWNTVPENLNQCAEYIQNSKTTNGTRGTSFSMAHSICKYYSRDQISCALDLGKRHFMHIDSLLRYCSPYNEATVEQLRCTENIVEKRHTDFRMANDICKYYSREQINCALDLGTRQSMHIYDLLRYCR